MDEEKQTKKRVMLGFTGNSFSEKFLIGWTKFLIELMKNNEFDINLSQGYSKNSTYMRMSTLGLKSVQPINSKAFDGVEYDVFVSIEPTILFTYEQFKTLVNATDNHPVVSGIYYVNEKNIFAIEKLDYEKHSEHEMIKRETIDSYKDKVEKMIRVDFTGLGFFACRRTVLQTLDFPYFWHPIVIKYLEDGTPCNEVLSEELSFCKRIRDKGFRIVIHTELKVYNEQVVLL